MTKPLRVLFLMEDLCFGGTQRQMLELARRLDRTRFIPAILTLTGKTDMDEEAGDGHVELVHLGTGRVVPKMFFLLLRRAILAARPDILLPCTALPNIWGRLWGRTLGIPVIIGTCRGGGGPRRQHERLLWRLTEKIVCNSDALIGVLRDMGIPANHLVCIPNGIDARQFNTLSAPLPSARAPIILCVARLALDKDHLTLFRAFARILQKIPQSRLRIVGDGPQNHVLRNWAANYPAGSNIDFFPGTSDVRAHYAQARLFALASVREGQPNVLLEAMACGLPVCATAVGGIPALVGDRGLLSPAGDATSLADNCLRLLADIDYCNTLGRAGREYVEQTFSFSRMVTAHEELFTRLSEKHVENKPVDH
jgi:glycosyltransferase involved in cell wall biosynthesis